jgi:hypothetical protein
VGSVQSAYSSWFLVCEPWVWACWYSDTASERGVWMNCVAAVDTGDLITVAAPWEGPKERDLSEDRGVYGRMGPESVFGRFAGGCVWSGFNWLKIGAGGRLLWMRWWTFGFWHYGISREACQHVTLQYILCFWKCSPLLCPSIIPLARRLNEKKNEYFIAG